MDRQNDNQAESDPALRSWFAHHMPPVPDDVLFERTGCANPAHGDGGRHGRGRPRWTGPGWARAGWFGATAALAAAALVLVPRLTAPRLVAVHPGPGATGQLAPLPTHLNLRAIDFLTPSLGFVAAPGRIYETTNGAHTGTRVYHGPVAIMNLHMVSPQDGFAWGPGRKGSVILATTDGGRRWVRVGTTPSRVMDAAFSTARVGYVVTSHGQLLKTIDGGRHWVSLRQSARSVSFTSATRGYVLNGLAVYQTRNGGQSWIAGQLTASPGSGGIIDGEVRAAPGGGVWASLIGGTGRSRESYTVFRSTNGAEWTAVIGVSTPGGGPAPGNPPVVGPGTGLGPLHAFSANAALVSGPASPVAWGRPRWSARPMAAASGSRCPSRPGPSPGLSRMARACPFPRTARGICWWTSSSRGTSQAMGPP